MSTPTEYQKLTTTGDKLQSAASRMAEWIMEEYHDDAIADMIPYEVAMAAAEARTAVDDWTEVRRG